ncbi:MAG: hypothetical protein IJQ91_05345 [Acidaminococcaceae bacterium]|nr:hypothetical protein [Acidaminococcaceae bacterium]
MKKTLAATAALLAICSFAFAAPPPGTFNSQRIHVSPSQRMNTPIHNRVRMTPAHGQLGPIGGRMSSIPNGYRHDRPSSAHVYVRPSHARVYVRPSLPLHHYRYGYSSIWWGHPIAYYSYPYGVYYGRYYARPAIHIGIRL